MCVCDATRKINSAADKLAKLNKLSCNFTTKPTPHHHQAANADDVDVGMLM